MKGILCACVLVSIQSFSPARAYEADIHYSTTYVLARAAGWTEAEARTIASANQAMDENKDTVAALEVDTTPSPSIAGYVMSSLHQAEKNLRFHCFSDTHGDAGGISADVRKVIAGHFAAVPVHDENPRKNARRLIALGVALHCQQDAYAHMGFGGSCGSYPGTCYGHTHETFLDQVVFGLLKKHHYNPDHPGVSGEQLLEALQGTASELAARKPGASSRPIPGNALAALSDKLRGSGLELPDDVRIECNRYIAGQWLFDFFRSGGRKPNSTENVERLGPGVAGTCKNDSLASATVITIPEPRFPNLKPDASPSLVRTDGTYQLLRSEDLEVSAPGIHAEGIAGLLPDYSTHRIKVQLSHWSQLLALPLTARVARLSEDGERKMR